MSRINEGQRFTGRIADILNKEFAARTAQGKPLAGWYKSAWPQGTPYLVNRKDAQRLETVVWFPFVTDDPKSKGVAGWLNLTNKDRTVIMTRYVGEASAQEEEYGRVARFIGKPHIIFARWIDQRNVKEFFGIYTSERKGNTFVYRRLADWIETNDWQR